MSTVFLLSAAIGGGVLVLQLLLSMVGMADHDFGGDHHGEVGDTLDLLSVRSLSAGLAFFGLGGMGAQALGFPFLLALPVGLVAGGAAAALVGQAMRLMLRMEEDNSLDMAHAIGAEGSVYLRIPGGRAAPGKVHVTVQGQMVELQAVSEQPLETGAQVMVIEVLGSDTVDVVPSPVLGGVADVSR
jgi:membrane protein implicated in regulation of membrane protease activity